LEKITLESLEKDESKQAIPPQEAFLVIRKFFIYFQPKNHRIQFDGICRYILSSILSSSSSLSYITVASNPKLTLPWIKHTKKILQLCSSFLRDLRADLASDHKSMMLYLNIILTLTNPQVWKLSPEGRAAMTIVCTKMMQELVSKGLLLSLQALLKKGLCQSRICLNKTELSAVLAISLRPIVMLKNDTQVSLFLQHIFSVPGLTLHLQNMAQESISVLNNSLSVKDVCNFLEKEQNFIIIFNALEGNYGLCLLANIIDWTCMDEKNITSNLASLVQILQCFLDSCQQYVVTKQSSSSHWHPILGWFSQREDPSLHESLRYVRKQLSRLWDVNITNAVFSPLIAFNQQQKTKCFNQKDVSSNSPSKNDAPLSLSRLKRVIDRASFAMSNSDSLVITGNPDSIKYLSIPEVALISSICSMYASALSTMTQIRLEILTGLCYNEALLRHLWVFISSLDDRSGLITFLELITIKSKASEIQVLTLFCECATHLIT
jgi:ubiquitin-protein ligase E3 B